MKKRFWSLLLVLVMVLTMIPTTVYEANATGQLMYRMPWSAGLEEVGPNNEVCDFNNQLITSPGMVFDLFFHVVENGISTERVTGGMLISSNKDVVRVSMNTENGNATTVEAVGIGVADIIYTDGNNNRYTVQVSVGLPDVGFYSENSATADTLLLSGFQLTDDNNTFYLISTKGNFVNVTLESDFENIADVSVNGAVATITVTDDPDPNRMSYIVNYQVDGCYPSSQGVSVNVPGQGGYPGTGNNPSGPIMPEGLSLQYCWANTMNGNLSKPDEENTFWNYVLTPTIGESMQVYFAIVENMTWTKDVVVDITSSNTNILSVEKLIDNEGYTYYRLNPKAIGEATLSCIVDGVNYSVAANVQLPPSGFYSSNEATPNTYIGRVIDVTTLPTTVYYISTSGAFDSVDLSEAFHEIADITWRIGSNVATIEITDMPTGGMYEVISLNTNMGPSEMHYSVSFMANGQNVPGNNPGGGGNPSGPNMPTGPALGYCWADWMNGVVSKPSGENVGWNTFMTPTIGSTMNLYFSIVENMVPTQDVVVDIISSNPNVLTIEKFIDDAGQTYYRLNGLSIGSSTLSCTVGGVEYTMTANVQLPPTGFYTSSEANPSTYTAGMIDATELPTTIYYVSNVGAFDSIQLNETFDAIADITWTPGSNVAQIVITDEPTGGNYEVIYMISNMGPSEMSDGVRFTSGNQGGPGYPGEPDMQPVGLLWHYEDDANSTLGDGICGGIGGQTEGWFIFYPEEGEPFTLAVEDLTVTNKDVVRISSVGTPENSDKIKMEFLDWGTSQIVFRDPDGKEYAFTVINDVDYIDTGFYTDKVISEDTYIPMEYTVTNDNNVVYLNFQNGMKIKNLALEGETKKYVNFEKINDYCYKFTVLDKICDTVSYGEYAEFHISFDRVDGDSGQHHGINLINRMCKHPETQIIGAKAEECMVAGYTGDEVCKQCKAVVAKGSVIPAGHSYDGDKCKVCGDKPVVVEKVETVDTTKPVEKVTPVVEQSVADTAAKEVASIVDAILADKVTDEVKEAVSEETIEAIKSELAAGKEITTAVTAKPVEEKDVDKEVVKEVEKELGTTGKVAQFLDLSIMIKSVAADSAEKDLGTLNVLGEKVKFTIVIPEDLVKEGREFYIVRVHDGEAEILDLTKNADGTYSFETDKFSTYALAYEEGKDIVAPKMGDDSNVLGYMMLFAVAFAAFALAKKENYLVK